MSIVQKRVRRSADDARTAALDAAQDLLRADGPTALTLKAVAAAIGVTHANLLHHFGSAAGLQDALMERMIRDAVGRVEATVARIRAGEGSPRDLVDAAFDAFSEAGIGRLAAWLHATGDAERLGPLFAVLGDLIRSLEAGALLPPDLARDRISDMTLTLVLMGFGDALAGPMLHEAVGRGRSRSRELATAMLMQTLVRT